jgi:hypothetical protein
MLFQITLPQTAATNACTARLVAGCRSFFKQSQGEGPRRPRAQIESTRTGELMHAFREILFARRICVLFVFVFGGRCCGVMRSSGARDARARELVRWLR